MISELSTSVAPHVVEPSVRRPRLECLLGDDKRRPVTLVCAPPGAGKTTLVGTWFAELGRGRGRWVTAAEGDGGLARVIADAARGHEGVLVIDDAHQLQGDALTTVDEVVNTPNGPDIVLLARADPALALSRWRLMGEVREIRGADLAFNAEEAALLLRSTGVDVRPSEVRRLNERTEGWAAGLRLIVCALERGASSAMIAEDETATQAAVSDYLLSEVLEREPDEVRRFLLRTSITDRLTPELAVLLADDPAGAAMLEDLHRRGLFVVSLGHGWYRYHSLFTALLRARLRVEDPALAIELHRWAACWFAARDLRGPAEEHARAGEHWTLVADLVRRRWRAATLAGDFHTQFAEGLPPTSYAVEPLLGLLSGATTASGLGPMLADEEAVLSRVRACADGRVDAVSRSAPRDVALRPVVAVLDAELALLVGDLDRASTIAGELATDSMGWTSRDARALLALIDAIEGRVDLALSRIADVVSQVLTDPGPGRIARAATTVATAVCEHQLGRDVDRSGLGEVGELATSLALRHCARALLAARHPSSGITLEPAMASDELVGRLLVAIGGLDVVESTGSRRSVGGADESAVRRAREALTAGSHHAARSDAANALGATHPRTAIEAAVILAVAAVDEQAADEAATSALATASRWSIWAPFVTHGPNVAPILARIGLRSGPNQSDAIAALELLHRCKRSAPIEPLTAREATVLRLLPTLMSNEEIAEVMVLSVNTVKTHLKALYRKLGVDRRRDAVVRARELDLL